MNEHPPSLRNRSSGWQCCVLARVGQCSQCTCIPDTFCMFEYSVYFNVTLIRRTYRHADGPYEVKIIISMCIGMCISTLSNSAIDKGPLHYQYRTGWTSLAWAFGNVRNVKLTPYLVNAFLGISDIMRSQSGLASPPMAPSDLSRWPTETTFLKYANTHDVSPKCGFDPEIIRGQIRPCPQRP